jgi:PBP1b-binding outer membrane lipoprotein LpoB
MKYIILLSIFILALLTIIGCSKEQITDNEQKPIIENNDQDVTTQEIDDLIDESFIEDDYIEIGEMI